MKQKQLDMDQELLDKEHISNLRNRKIQSLKCITPHLQRKSFAPSRLNGWR